ncbi:MAG TPA: phosphoenolpyruvate carboxykinase (ATP) [candidate division Zixibacteria bacterium]|nr:phosphoenolpyruvate carboxykinase (ATP) [candidate division Zixibacteria bacterium]
MSDSLYDMNYYSRFHRDLQRRLNGPNIKEVKLSDMKEPSYQTGQRTKYGSWGWRSAVSSRIGGKTVYLGSEKVREFHLSDQKKDIIRNAPEELDKVLHLMETLPIAKLSRQMGENSEFNPKCNLYMSMADPKNARNVLMWGHTMGKATKAPGPEFTLIHIPEEHHIRQQVLMLPDYNTTIVLGSDYMGEDKKGFLRNGMHAADNLDMLGLHAGTKVVIIQDKKSGKLKKYGVFLFGLSATGKSTWSCHQLGLDWKKGERTLVCQDDICFLKNDGSAYGSEQNYFVKTDVDKKLQESMYNALIHKSAMYENVMIDSEGNPQFLDENLCGNGRAVIMRKQLKIRRGHWPFAMKNIWYPSLNLPPVDELDGIVFAFITRRNTIMTFSQRLNPTQAALAYLWGESSHSYASNPAKAGESVRTVGTDPFIVGSRAEKVNKFYKIVMDLADSYPDKVHFFQYNTGGMGEIIEKDKNGNKKMIRKTERVPIDTMAAIQRGDLRGTNEYRPSFLGTEEILSAEGVDLSMYRPEKYYSREQIDNYVRDLVNGRRKFTEQVAEEGLMPEIIRAAEESFSIAPDKAAKVSMASIRKREEPPPPKEKPAAKLTDWKPNPRLARDRGWRYG